jgi:hypothetical protein
MRVASSVGGETAEHHGMHGADAGAVASMAIAASGTIGI